MDLQNEPRRFCRKCLLQDMDESSFYERLRRHIANLDEDLKVSDEIYAKRLSCCRACDNLMSGMCRICGCYVELRAVMKKNICPMVHPRWTAVKEEESDKDR